MALGHSFARMVASFIAGFYWRPVYSKRRIGQMIYGEAPSMGPMAMRWSSSFRLEVAMLDRVFSKVRYLAGLLKKGICSAGPQDRSLTVAALSGAARRTAHNRAVTVRERWTESFCNLFAAGGE